ncbi:MAG TPA: hypothetical protein VK595_03120 [Vicinamibacterales bacterium]|nr:hypothetical protein [Vicinamibacterales bacterium]
MIIEAGYDLRELLFPNWAGNDDEPSVRLVTFDESLRFLYRRRIADAYLGDLDHHHDEIASALTSDYVRYFAVGHPVPELDSRGGFWREYDGGERVRATTAGMGLHFLGHLVHDKEWWGSSGPVHRFEDYPGSDEVPRAIVIPGPHPFLECDCAACGPRNRRFPDVQSDVQQGGNGEDDHVL